MARHSRKETFREALLDVLREKPTLTQSAVSGYLTGRVPYFAGGGYLRERLFRLTWKGDIGFALRNGRNEYFARAALRGVQDEMDLQDPDTRKVAADLLEERGGPPELAALLRYCQRVTVLVEGPLTEED